MAVDAPDSAIAPTETVNPNGLILTPMKFIDPTTDFGFKKIFGSAEHSEVLLSFLNAVLYEGNPVLEEITPEVLDWTELNPRIPAPPLRVNAKLNGDTTCLIEIQVLSLPTLSKRVLFNAAKTYALQLNKTDVPLEIKPLMTLTITDFEMFEQQPNIVSRFALKEVEQGFDYPNNELGLVFIELPKFKKTVEQLTSVTDQWLYFLKQAGTLQAIPPNFQAIPALTQAFACADSASLSREEFDVLQQQRLFIADQRESLSLGRSQGLQEGIEQGKQAGIREGIEQGKQAGIQEGIKQGRLQGLQEGIEQGKQQGIEQGKQQGMLTGQFAIVLRSLKRRFGDISKDLQGQIKQLSSEQLENLAEVAWDFITELELMEWVEDQLTQGDVIAEEGEEQS
ncbi:Rpn family recombination-promoting nuclease/putative transposase [Spirulina subsalsa FACHB-351]|uniref:Rpn family recombination-promoting nuclease/putative transposase n=1 Tax=Spirulina subsalsa FACHB-351 TaxID=234711 RepID=A0ABT3LB75_9CYAN|nr:Rpn family recombination-promoting nuclease/putative transposase [Spirulina subsalsa]MCW6038764.1 Rpn family recombination-promoting nuclease/putative transposase [Spirulina subsalsa FACHB-351]